MKINIIYRILSSIFLMPYKQQSRNHARRYYRYIVMTITNRTKKRNCLDTKCQRWSRGHKARGQGHKNNPRPRPRTAFPRTDTLEAKDRNARGQGPRTQSASALRKKKKGLHKNFSGDLQKKKKKKVFTKIFQAISTKKRFPKNFSTAPQNFNFPKNSAVLEPRTGQFSRT